MNFSFPFPLLKMTQNEESVNLSVKFRYETNEKLLMCVGGATPLSYEYEFSLWQETWFENSIKNIYTFY